MYESPHEAARPAGDILPIVFGRPAWRLGMSKCPRDRMIVDNRQSINDNASLECFVSRVGDLSPGVVSPIAAHAD